MNFPAAEFWRLVRTDKRIKELSYGLDEHPAWGIGSKGGGRVMICENCGHIKYVENKTQNFCSQRCRIDYQNKDTSSGFVPKEFAGAKKRKNLHRNCGYCGEKFKVTISKMKAGEGIYCCAKCANRAKGLKALWYKCNTCGTHFRAVTDMGSRFCSIECAAKKPTMRDNGEYFEALPQPLEPTDFFEHKLNLLLKELQSNNPNLIITQEMRFEAISGTLFRKHETYYLKAHQREQLEELNRILELRMKKELPQPKSKK